MRFSFIHPFKLDLRDGHTQVAEVTVHAPLHDTSEGSEFLDDALRMEDLSITPYANTEESVAAGSHKQNHGTQPLLTVRGSKELNQLCGFVWHYSMNFNLNVRHI